MILTLGGMFLFNLLCGLVPCDPKFQTPEILSTPKDETVLVRNIEKRNISPVVKTRSGTVEGYLMKSTMGKEFFAFEGIPYGESTGGSRRWKPPVPKRPWRGVLQAKMLGSECTQISLTKLLRVFGSDNCLYINVYTPWLSPTKLNTVVVFIHGGSFIFGSGGEYGPSYIMNEDNIVYVSFNYRLGPLGFMSTGDEALPGNYGLKDQALALKWVYENIEFFGGDPSNISLWGNSAGAVSDWFPLPPVLFSPIVEPNHPDAFLTVTPEDAYKMGTVAKKPYVIGMTKDEGKTVLIILLPLMKTFPLRVMWDQIAPSFLQYKSLVKDPADVTRRISNFYFKGKSPREASLNDFSDMVTDRYLSLGIVKGLQAHASTGAPTYMYQFSFSDGNHNLANVIGYRSSEWGASHSEDIYYFFNDSIAYDGHKLSDPDHQLSSIMINVMTNFARNGEPSYTLDTDQAVKLWRPVKNPTHFEVLQFDKVVEMTTLTPRQIERVNFWSSLNISNYSLSIPLETSDETTKAFKIIDNII